MVLKVTGQMTRQFTRRRFLGSLASGAVGLAAAGVYAWRIEPHWVAVENVELPFPEHLAHWRGRRIVQISDLHVGKRMDDDFLRECFATIASLAPDLILVTGDYMTCRADEQVEHVGAVMKSLPAAPLGRYGILGNHDYGHAWDNELAADRVTGVLEKLNISMLRNERCEIDGLTMMGADDLWSPRYDERAIERMIGQTMNTPSPFAIAMCHNPDGADRAEWRGLNGWMLAGHTHGGQCSFPFFGAPITPVRNKRYVAGAYALDDRRTLYINRGLGYSRRIRFNSRPEITVFTVV